MRSEYCYIDLRVAHEVAGIEMERVSSTSKTPGPEKGGPAYHGHVVGKCRKHIYGLLSK